MPLSMLTNPRPKGSNFCGLCVIAPSFRYRIPKRLLPRPLTQVLSSSGQRQLFIEPFANHFCVDAARLDAAQTAIGRSNNDARPFRNGLLPQNHA